MAASLPGRFPPNVRKTAADGGSRWAHHEHLLSRAYQIHSPDQVVATGPLEWRRRGPRSDAIVTRFKVLPFRRHRGRLADVHLWVDPNCARDWGCACGVERRAVSRHSGIPVEAYGKSSGAEQAASVAAIGPDDFRQHSYQVGRRKFVDASCRARDAENTSFFIPSGRVRHAIVRSWLASFRMRSHNAGVLMIDRHRVDLPIPDESATAYRRSVHQGERTTAAIFTAIVALGRRVDANPGRIRTVEPRGLAPQNLMLECYCKTAEVDLRRAGSSQTAVTTGQQTHCGMMVERAIAGITVGVLFRRTLGMNTTFFQSIGRNILAGSQPRAV